MRLPFVFLPLLLLSARPLRATPFARRRALSPSIVLFPSFVAPPPPPGPGGPCACEEAARGIGGLTRAGARAGDTGSGGDPQPQGAADDATAARRTVMAAAANGGAAAAVPDARNERPKYEIGDALYSDLPRCAELTALGFYPDVIAGKNPVMRYARILLELDRLQSNFPYGGDIGGGGARGGGDDGDRHYYLVARVAGDDDGGAGSDVVGFCDLDGRPPPPPSFLASLFSAAGGDSDGRNVGLRPYLSDLSVCPSRRREGVASALMDVAERRASDGWECKALYLGVDQSNGVAGKMYGARGYEAHVYKNFEERMRRDSLKTKVLRRRLDLSQ